MSAVERRVLEVVAGLGLATGDIDRATTLDDLGIDPPDMVELADVLRRDFGLSLTPEQLEPATTAGELVDIVLAAEA